MMNLVVLLVLCAIVYGRQEHAQSEEHGKDHHEQHEKHEKHETGTDIEEMLRKARSSLNAAQNWSKDGGKLAAHSLGMPTLENMDEVVTVKHGKHTHKSGKRSIFGKRSVTEGEEGAAEGEDGFVVDVCPNGSTVDTDDDGFLDCHDECPKDPKKTVPGDCGCGASDKDKDGDGVADCLDQCPEDSDKFSTGVCGCGRSDTGCGCNVAALSKVHGCKKVLGEKSASAFAVFNEEGEVEARVVVPHDALQLTNDEQIILELGKEKGPTELSSLVHSRTLSLGVVTHGQGKSLLDSRRSDLPNGEVLLARAATVCMRPSTTTAGVKAEHLNSDLCLGFYDHSSKQYKCFEAVSAPHALEGELICGRIALLTDIQLIRKTHLSSMRPFLRSSRPRVCPADGDCELKLVGGNFDKGVLTRVMVGDSLIDPRECQYTSTEVTCSHIPAGRGKNLDVEVQFTNHAAHDMRVEAKLADALSYEAPVIHELALVDDRIVVRGHNFGPAGAAKNHKDIGIVVGGELCGDARVDVANKVMSCQPSKKQLSRKRSASRREHGHKHHGNHAEVTVGDQVVVATRAHDVPECDHGAGEFQCQDNSCVGQSDSCAVCPSGQPLCPLSLPIVDAAGKCHAFSWAERSGAEQFDVVLDGTSRIVHVGSGVVVQIPADDGPDAGKTCVSFSSPKDKENDKLVSSVVTIAGNVGNVLVSFVATGEDVDALGYGVCLAQYQPKTGEWFCIDEMVSANEFGLVGSASVDGEATLALIKDNCPEVENPKQRDIDGDGTGDVCDGSKDALVINCRDTAAGNKKYLQKVMEKTRVRDIDHSPGCPDKTSNLAICDTEGAIFKAHKNTWKGDPVALRGPVENGAKKGQ